MVYTFIIIKTMPTCLRITCLTFHRRIEGLFSQVKWRGSWVCSLSLLEKEQPSQVVLCYVTKWGKRDLLHTNVHFVHPMYSLSSRCNPIVSILSFVDIGTTYIEPEEVLQSRSIQLNRSKSYIGGQVLFWMDERYVCV